MAYGFKIQYVQDGPAEAPDRRCEIDLLKEHQNDEVNVPDVVDAAYKLLVMAWHVTAREGTTEAREKIDELLVSTEAVAKHLVIEGCQKIINYKTLSGEETKKCLTE